MSQAPGFRGTPASGHCSSAATSASCASSSAVPTSPIRRARLAMSRGASIRQTASIARWASELVTRPSVRERADVEFDVPGTGGEARRPGERVLELPHLEHHETGDEFLRFGKWPVGDGALAAPEPEPQS